MIYCPEVFLLDSKHLQFGVVKAIPGANDTALVGDENRIQRHFLSTLREQSKKREKQRFSKE